MSESKRPREMLTTNIGVSDRTEIIPAVTLDKAVWLDWPYSHQEYVLEERS